MTLHIGVMDIVNGCNIILDSIDTGMVLEVDSSNVELLFL